MASLYEDGGRGGDEGDCGWSPLIVDDNRAAGGCACAAEAQFGAPTPGG